MITEFKIAGMGLKTFLIVIVLLGILGFVGWNYGMARCTTTTENTTNEPKATEVELNDCGDYDDLINGLQNDNGKSDCKKK